MDDLPTFNKMDAAQANLRGAIMGHFERAHPVSVETMSGAANVILRDLGKKNGLSGAIHDSDFFEGENRKKWGNVLRDPQNFYKHADKDAADATMAHNPLITHLLMVESCQLFRKLAGDFMDEIELMVFEIWFVRNYPSLAGDAESFLSLHPFGDDLRLLQVGDFPAWIAYIKSRRLADPEPSA